MLPGPTAPRSLAGLLAEFRPCFTAPTFHTFVGLVVGLIAQTRRRTVCGMLTGAGLEQVWHHSRAHRLFTNARWSGDALGLALADLIVARLLPPDSALTIAVDDTLFKRTGRGRSPRCCTSCHHRAGRSGRPRTRGPRLGTPTDLAASATLTGQWRETRVSRYGRTDIVRVTEVILSLVRIVSQPNRARDPGAR